MVGTSQTPENYFESTKIIVTQSLIKVEGKHDSDLWTIIRDVMVSFQSL